MNKIKAYFSENHQKIANIASIFGYFVGIPATIISVLFTYYSIETSAKLLGEQLAFQSRATSIDVVDKFIRDVHNIMTNPNFKKENRDVLYVSKTKFVLATVDFPELTSHIISSLASSNLGYLFDVTRTINSRQFIDLSNLDLTRTHLESVELIGPNFNCSELSEMTVISSSFSRSNFPFSQLSNIALLNSKFHEAFFYWSNLGGSNIAQSSFKNSTILFSNLRGIIFDKSGEIPRSKEVEEISKILLETKSLYGSIMDSDVKQEIIKQGGEKLISNPPIFPPMSIDKETKSLLNTYKIDKELSNQDWTKEWRKKRLRNCTMH